MLERPHAPLPGRLGLKRAVEQVENGGQDEPQDHHGHHNDRDDLERRDARRAQPSERRVEIAIERPSWVLNNCFGHKTSPLALPSAYERSRAIAATP